MVQPTLFIVPTTGAYSGFQSGGRYFVGSAKKKLFCPPRGGEGKRPLPLNMPMTNNIEKIAKSYRGDGFSPPPHHAVSKTVLFGILIFFKLKFLTRNYCDI